MTEYVQRRSGVAGWAQERVPQHFLWPGKIRPLCIGSLVDFDGFQRADCDTGEYLGGWRTEDRQSAWWLCRNSVHQYDRTTLICDY